MKVVLTADLHLTSRDRNPERFETLDSILSDMRAKDVSTLIIAGDLFDASMQDYSDFEKLCRKPDYQEIDIHVIPGNHDPTISKKKIVADNLQIYTEPTWLDMGGRPVLFVPYRDDATMGEEIAEAFDEQPVEQWVLVGHGDWLAGVRVPNALEPGVYMPLTRADVTKYKPTRVFLGHIHASMDATPVHYVGSPCGLDISETGRRRCLLYDTATDHIETMMVVTPVLYLNESFVILPMKDELAYLREQIAACKQGWGLSAAEHDNAQLRVQVAGYSTDRAALRNLLQEEFGAFTFYKGEEPSIDAVRNVEEADLDRQLIAEHTYARVEDLEWPFGADEPERDEIMLAALQLIYGS